MENIDYTVRISRRARYARIVVRPNLSVEVVLPTGVAKYRAFTLLQEKRAWVERSLKRFGEHHRTERADVTAIPTQVKLEAIGEQFSISCRQTASAHIRISELNGELHITGSIDDPARRQAGLQQWLKRKAKAHLPALLDELAEMYGFRYKRVTIRLQKSRWGSCTKGGNISLNAKLLFLPEHLMRYVMLHELAHLKQMNHSAAFWREVARCDPGFMAHRKEMRHVSQWIPAWAEAITP